MTMRDNHLHPLSSFQRNVIRGFLHLSDRSPSPHFSFLPNWGLPIVARLHRDIFSLFYNIWIKPETKILKITKYLLEDYPLNSHTLANIKCLSAMYGMEDPARLISQPPPSKCEFRNIVHTKITVYQEKKLRAVAITNSKTTYLNVSLKGLNGRPHPALSGIVTTQSVKNQEPT